MSGCVTIESPDNLVSDTIEAGKDAYQSVKESISDEPVEKEKAFVHEYTVTVQEPIATSINKCLEIVVETTKVAIDKPQLDIKETITNSTQRESQLIVNCKIVIKTNN